MDEFDLIDRYFRPLGFAGAGVDLGIGDDAAVLNAPPGEQLVVTTDTQVESVHFPTDANAGDIGYRSCATSLSDIAAMGASARWASLALTIPRAQDSWLKQFANGAAQALQSCGATLVGGDTTAGSLVITWHIIGTVPLGTALTRSGARHGDAVYVSGALGGARAALALPLTGKRKLSDVERALVERYWRPQPRFELGRKLCGLATACVDVSDGLIADLTHIVRSSGCGAVLQYSKIPVAREARILAGDDDALRMAATGGDDYELCFTLPLAREAEMFERLRTTPVSITRVGEIVHGEAVQVTDDAGATVEIGPKGYRHFA